MPEPERLDVFMARANATYYAERDPFADFTTAPEIGQVFGELLGAWAAVTWAQMGAPHPVLLVEAGPGRGTLMADLRRATARVAAGFHAACHVHLIETSHRLRAEQRARVPDATWHDALASLPEGPTILLANEFLDALPIRQFVRTDTGWAERHVGNGRFVDQALQTSPPAAAGRTREGGTRAGDILEHAPATLAWIQALAQRLVRHGGGGLILDYGTAETGAGDTLQALRDGKPADPLAAPGTADLTAHVDFAAIAATAQAQGVACWGPVPQGLFLQRLGLHARTERLAAARPDRADTLRLAAERLAHPDRMGTLFKALCLTRTDLPPPAGFAS